MKEKPKIILILFLIIVAVSGLLIAKNNIQLPGVRNTSETETEPKPRLEMVKYNTQTIDPNKTKLTSTNYNFEIIFPSEYEASRGFGFDKEFPENETVSVGARDKESHEGVSLNVGIGFLNNNTVTEVVQQHIKGAKQNINPSGNPNEIGDEEISLERESLTINGENVVKLRYIGAFDQETISYYFHKENKYYIVSFNRNDGKQFTTDQLQEINEVVNSFQFI